MPLPENRLSSAALAEALVSDPRAFLRSVFFSGVEAALPRAVLSAHMPAKPKGKTIVVGAGKAAAQMALAFEALWPHPVAGLVVTQYGCGAKCAHIEIVEAAHPVPDAMGFDGAQRLLDLAEKAGEDDLVVALISGGGSSLLPAPVEGLTLADEQAINKALLACGAPISQINAVRKVFSRIKGGRLAAAAYPARVVSLIISDVPGDDPALVASGPTVADATGIKEARAIVEKYRIDLPPAALKLLNAGASPPLKPGDKLLGRATHQVIASAALSLNEAARQARGAGCEVIQLSDALEGEARELGAMHGALMRKYKTGLVGSRVKPLLVLSGGETSVSIEGGLANAGKGGRNTEYLLSLALEIEGLDNVLALAADTDGRDGSEDNAGAFADGTSVQRMASAGIDARQLLERHDAWRAFNGVDDLLITGPTQTNVNDFRALLIWS